MDAAQCPQYVSTMKKNNLLLLVGIFFVSTFLCAAPEEETENSLVPITLVHSNMRIPRSFHSNKAYAVISKEKGTFVFVSPMALEGKVFSTNEVNLTTNDLYLVPSSLLKLSDKDREILTKKPGLTRKLTNEEISRLEKYQFVITAEKESKNHKKFSALELNTNKSFDQTRPHYQEALFLFDSDSVGEALLCLATAPVCLLLEILAMAMGTNGC